MKSVSKRILAAMLSSVVTLSSFGGVLSDIGFAAVEASAEENTDVLIETDDIADKIPESSGDGSELSTLITRKVGDDVTLTLNTKTGGLYIEGTGSVSLDGDSVLLGEERPYVKAAVIAEGVADLPGGIFEDCENLETISLPTTLTELPNRMFYGCSSLKNVVIPDSVTKIGSAVFARCSSITEITIPDSVAELGTGVFFYCEGLVRAKLPSGITEIPHNFFGNCSSLESVDFPQDITEIASYAFYECSSLKSFSIPAGVTEIKDATFEGTGLTEIYIPKTIKKIGKFAFEHCADAEKLTFDEGIEYIGEMSFLECEKISSIKIPDSVKYVGSNAFGYTKYFDDLYNNYTEGMVITDEGILLAYDINYSNDKDIVIPDRVRMIAAGTFLLNTEIESITISKNVTAIPEEMCRKCLALKTVNFLGEVESIGESAFYNCPSLTNINTSDSLKRIETSAFEDCTSLENIYIPDTIEYIGGSSFENTAFVKNFDEDFMIFGNVLYMYKGSDESVIVPDEVTVISPLAISYNDAVKNLVLPDGVEKIGDDAVLSCKNLKSVFVPASVTEIGTHAIGYSYDGNDYDLTNSVVIFGDENTEAQRYASENSLPFRTELVLKGQCGENAFYELNMKTGELKITGTGKIADCYSSSYDFGYKDYSSMIKSVTVDEGITRIGYSNFSACDEIESIKLPDTVTEIGNWAFDNCGLKELKLPESIESIGNYAFYNNEIKEFYVSKNIKEIGRGAFICNDMERFAVSSENENFFEKDGVLYNNKEHKLIFIPEALKSTFVEIPDEIKSSELYAVFSLENVERIIFPDGFEGLGELFISDIQCPKLNKLVFKGSSPDKDTLRSKVSDGMQIYCSFSDPTWKSAMSYFKENVDVEVEFIDLDTQSEGFKLKCERTELLPGEAIQLSFEMSPAVGKSFVMETDNSDVVFISEQGNVFALNAGTAVVTARSTDGEYYDSITLTVSDKKTVYSKGAVKLDGEKFNFDGNDYKLVFSEKLKGLYILDKDNLYFYSIINNEYFEIHEFDNCQFSYVENDKLYIAGNQRCTVYDLNAQKEELTFSTEPYKATAIGADKLGRIYIAAEDSRNEGKYKLLIYDSKGNLLSSTKLDSEVYAFGGFNEKNGDFFIEQYEWGFIFSVSGVGIKTLNFSDNVVTSKKNSTLYSGGGNFYYDLNFVEILDDDYYYSFWANNAAILGGKYLTSFSSMQSCVFVNDINSPEYERLFKFKRRELEDSFSLEEKNKNVCAFYNEENDSIVLYCNSKNICEYSLKTGELLSAFNAEHYVFDILKADNYIAALEKENGEIYLEYLDMTPPTAVSIAAERAEMTVGESQKLSINLNSDLIPQTCKLTSTDNRIATVTKNGTVVAWHEGTVTITYEWEDIKAECVVKVNPKSIFSDKQVTLRKDAELTTNMSYNNYSTYGSVVESYLFENGNGYTRLESLNSKKVVIENYTKDFKYVDSRELDFELPLFGGFFSGADSNFIVYGQNNSENSDDTEVLRVVKYSKDWERQSSVSLYGKNTSIPFEAGSLRMDEADGKLYIYTCHEMYNGHQANMTYVVDESAMSIDQEYYEVGNTKFGYVSHSFNEFIKVDNGYVYRLDQGDAAPRGIVLTRASVDDVNSVLEEEILLDICYTDNYNSTGVSIGGFEINDKYCIAAGNSVDQSDPQTYSPYANRNIFVAATAKDNFGVVNTVWLTDYENNDIAVRTPHLIKLNNEHYFVMWEEYDYSSEKTVVKGAAIDEGGNVSDIKTYENARLSDCKPIYSEDKVVWYVSDGEKVEFYSIDPYLHTEKVIEGKLPTCTEDGLTSGTVCTECGEIIQAQEKIPATGHKFVNGVCVICEAVEKSDSDTDTDSGKKPTTDTDTDSGKKPTTDTDTDSGKKPTTDTDTDSGKKPTTDTDTDSGKKPTTDTDTDSGKKPTTDTDTDSGKKPNTDTGTDTDPSDKTKLLIGDVNDDGSIDSFDSLLVLRAAVELEKLSADQNIRADVDLSGLVDSLDALEILRYAVGLPSSESIGKYYTK